MSDEPFTAESLNDEIALNTQWSPLKPGGTNTTDFKFSKISSRRVEFKASPKLYIAAVVFIILGSAAIIKFSMEPSGSLLFYGGVGLGIILILNGIYKFFDIGNPPVFDLDEGYFWKDQKKPDKDKKVSATQCRIDNIHAIQLIQERIQSGGSSGSSSYYSFEMNLVLENGNRLNVVDHGTLSRIRKNADQLSNFLDVPVWDAINRKS
ncbi:hypothetical protein [Rhodohalobacter sulfatireducens]|uniref:Uncharacterized protein n=1 Tax=Rhodohalobacter sulfatireducens TaxID=2911366 RepID=A0ABS9K998_9BACT|nr:hypothetical protein [Rhodohalobacter sulfatireducens]MCG2587416.1 hypothetical protein [Rhodohalobacter sulfatireducens]